MTAAELATRIRAVDVDGEKTDNEWAEAYGFWPETSTEREEFFEWKRARRHRVEALLEALALTVETMPNYLRKIVEKAVES